MSPGKSAKKNSLRLMRTAWVCLTLLAACVRSVAHDESLAGKRALEFAQLALVRQDFDKAYALLSASAKRYVPLEKLRESVAKLYPGNTPTAVVATAYEPMPGENAIYIYLVGQNAGVRLDYTVTMDGTATTDYKVAKIIRGHNTYLPATSGKKSFGQPITSPP